MKLVKSSIIGMVIFLVFVSLSYAAGTSPKPILYGQLFNGNQAADGSIVTVYPQSNSSDNITSIVGQDINSSYWKTNLQHLSRNVQNGDIIVIHAADGEHETSRTYAVDLGDGLVSLSLNYDPAFQDYDNDGYSQNQGECNDNSAGIHPGASDTCGDGIDQNCDGSDTSCPAPSSTGGSGSGSGGGGGGGGGFYVCNRDWQCGEWSSCVNGQQTRTCNLVQVPQHTQSDSCPSVSNAPATTQACQAPVPTTSLEGQGEGTQQTPPETDEGATASAGQEVPEQPPTAPTGFAAFTGNVISALTTTGGIITALIVLILIGTALYFGYYYLYKNKEDEDKKDANEGNQEDANEDNKEKE